MEQEKAKRAPHVFSEKVFAINGNFKTLFVALRATTAKKHFVENEAEVLRAQGLDVINPAEHGIVKGAEWADYLRHDIAGLVSCERIHLLRGWEKSKGARLEFQIATELGMEVTHQVEPT